MNWIFQCSQIRFHVKILGKKHKNLYYRLWENVGFPGGSDIENMPVMQETWVQFLGWEDSLEKGMATHSSILAWRISWGEEPGGLQSTGSQKVGHN